MFPVFGSGTVHRTPTEQRRGAGEGGEWLGAEDGHIGQRYRDTREQDDEIIQKTGERMLCLELAFCSMYCIVFQVSSGYLGDVGVG